MKYFQGPITAAWFPPLIGRQHKNIQKKLKKNAFWMGKNAFWMGKNAVSDFVFFVNVPKFPKWGHLFDQHFIFGKPFPYL